MNAVYMVIEWVYTMSEYSVYDEWMSVYDEWMSVYDEWLSVYDDFSTYTITLTCHCYDTVLLLSYVTLFGLF